MMSNASLELLITADTLCFDQGKYPEAMRLYNDGIKRYPHNHDLLSRRANLNRLFEKHYLALDDVDTVLQSDPYHLYALYTKIRILSELEKKADALYLYNMHKHLLTTSKRILQQKAAAASALGKYQDAKVLCEQLLKSVPMDPSILYTKGVSEFYLSEYQQSIASLQASMQSRPTHVLAKRYIEQAFLFLNNRKVS